LPMGMIWCAGKTISFRILFTGTREPDDVEPAAAVVDWHVAALAMIFTIGEELVHKFDKSKTSLLEHARLPVLTKYHVFGDERRC